MSATEMQKCRHPQQVAAVATPTYQLFNIVLFQNLFLGLLSDTDRQPRRHKHGWARFFVDLIDCFYA